MSSLEQFWKKFEDNHLEEALCMFKAMPDIDKEIIFSVLFQKAKFQNTPQSISILSRRLLPNANYQQFYKAWQPSSKRCHPLMIGNMPYQQFFDAPIRTINAVSFSDPNEIITIGLHWVSDKKLLESMDSSEFKISNQERNEKIKEAAKKEFSGIYKVLDDDNLGTPFT